MRESVRGWSGRRLRSARLDGHLTQEDSPRWWVWCSHCGIARWESGSAEHHRPSMRAPSPKHARAIADALDRCSPICSQSTEIVGETVPLPRL